jgi:hypothetical protein
MFCKANGELNDDQTDDDDDGEGEADASAAKKNKAAGTIALELCKTRPVAASRRRTTQLMPGYAFTPRSVVPDKKESFGIERSVSVGATTTGDQLRLSDYHTGEFIEKLEVRYRTAKFFHMLQCRINPPGIAPRHTTRTRTRTRHHTQHTLQCAYNGIVEVKQAEGPVAVIDLVDDDDDEEHTERRAKKRIKLEPATPSMPALGNDATVDTFLCRLAAYVLSALALPA